MPVYNGEPYLREALESILSQTYRDFELILINDAGTDGSGALIRSFGDPRIRYYENDRNSGLIATLNRGIDLARGKYIARMDQDDVAIPGRFAAQVKWLEDHPETGLVAAPVEGLTPGGKSRDRWPADSASVTFEQIRKLLPSENCIAHPTVMGRTEVFKKYHYHARQVGSEDWDLWLRMVRDGVRIEKVPQVLLRYRIHPASSTIINNLRRSPQLRSVTVKWRFFKTSLAAGRVNAFVLRCLATVVRDLGYHLKTRYLPRAFRKFKYLLSVNPLRAWADLRWMRAVPVTRHYFMFSYSHVGGAERVHAAIVRLIDAARPLVLFTGLHDKGGLESEFGDPSRVRNVSAALYHPFFARRARTLLLKRIGDSDRPVLFGSNSAYFYDLAAVLPGTVRKIDLTHDVSYGEKALPVNQLLALLSLQHRIFISRRALEKTREMYSRNFVDDPYFDRLRLVYNCVATTREPPVRVWSGPYQILYVGRDSPEKRLHLVTRLAARAAEAELPFRFVVAGPVRRTTTGSNITFTGAVTSREKLEELYNSAHFVIITSRSEGFPLSLMEGMAQGCIPISTAVGDIPNHVRHAENGLLLKGSDDDEVIASAFGILQNIHEFSLPSLSQNAFAYCKTTFDRERFAAAYRELLA